MVVDPEPSVAFLEKAKAEMGGTPTPPAAPVPDAPVEPTPSAPNADTPPAAEPSGQPAAPATGKAPDLSLFEAEDRERIEALPLEAQHAAVAVAKRMQAHLTRETQKLSSDRKYLDVGKRLLEDEETRKDFFKFQQERLTKGKEAPPPAAPKAPRKWTEAATDEDLDRLARETTRDEVQDLRDEVRTLRERLLAPQEKVASATAAWNAAVEAEGIDPNGAEYTALTKFVNATIAGKGLMPAEVVNESNAAVYLALARAAAQGKPAAAPTPVAPPAARAATIKSSGTGMPTRAKPVWEAQGRQPTEGEFFADFAKSQYGLTEGDLGDLRKSGARVITTRPA